MAVISKTEMVIGTERFIRVLKCDAKGNFSLNLSPAMAEVLGYGEVEGKTKEAVEQAFGEAKHKYLNAGTSHRRVIIYKVSINASIWTGHQGDLGNLERKDHTWEPGTILGLVVGVYDEEKITTAGQDRYKWRFESSSIPRGFNPGQQQDWQHFGTPNKSGPWGIVEWTQEAEDFFCSMALAMESMILKLNDIFSDQEKVKQIIASGQKLLTMSE